MKKYKLLTIILAAVLLTGCWDSIEYNRVALITMIGVDKKDDKVSIYLEKKPVSKSAQSEKKVKSPSEYFFGEGKDLIAAYDSFMRKNPEDVFLGATRVLVFSDSYAKEGIQEYLFRVRGLRDYRKTIFVVTTNTDFKKFFNSEQIDIESVGLQVENNIKSLANKGLILENRLSDILENSLEKHTGIILANFDVVENGDFILNGYSIFKEDKKIGFIPEDQINSINILLTEKARVNYSEHIEGLTVEFEKKLLKRKIIPHYKDRQITFDIDLKFNCEIVSISKTVAITEEMVKKLEQLMNKTIEKEVREAIEISQKTYGIDYLNFYEHFRAKYASAYERMNWNEEYKKAKFNIKAHSKIKFANLINYEKGE